MGYFSILASRSDEISGEFDAFLTTQFDEFWHAYVILPADGVAGYCLIGILVWPAETH